MQSVFVPENSRGKYRSQRRAEAEKAGGTRGEDVKGEGSKTFSPSLPPSLRNPCAPQTNRAQLPYVRSLSNPRTISQLLNPQSEKGRLERGKRRAGGGTERGGGYPSLSPRLSASPAARVSARRGAVDDVEPGRQTLSSPERDLFALL